MEITAASARSESQKKGSFMCEQLERDGGQRLKKAKSEGLQELGRDPGRNPMRTSGLR